MIDVCPFAIQRPGPADKQGYAGHAPGPKKGEVKHSAEGFWPGLYSRLDGPDRASWHFTIGYDRIEQHYPVSALCWHAGDITPDDGAAGNLELVGVEHLGLAGQPLTEYQFDATARLSRWLHDTNAWPAYNLHEQWFEHNWISQAATSCPSNRIDWTRLKARVEEEMPEAVTQAILRQLAVLGEKVDKEMQARTEADSFTREILLLCAAGRTAEADAKLRAVYGWAGLPYPLPPTPVPGP